MGRVRERSLGEVRKVTRARSVAIVKTFTPSEVWSHLRVLRCVLHLKDHCVCFVENRL